MRFETAVFCSYVAKCPTVFLLYSSGDSTTSQLIELVDEIHKFLDNSCGVRSVFLDISKAFDEVWHEGLIFKLSTTKWNQW